MKYVAIMISTIVSVQVCASANSKVLLPPAGAQEVQAEILQSRAKTKRDAAVQNGLLNENKKSTNQDKYTASFKQQDQSSATEIRKRDSRELQILVNLMVKANCSRPKESPIYSGVYYIL